MLGFMLTTMFLSMWVSNTATTAMMVPIISAVMNELNRKKEGEESTDEEGKYTIFNCLSLLNTEIIEKQNIFKFDFSWLVWHKYTSWLTALTLLYTYVFGFDSIHQWPL